MDDIIRTTPPPPRSAALPPGPRSVTLTLLAVMRDCCRYYADCARRYGDPFTLPSPYGPIVATGRPAGIQAVFTAHPGTFGVWAKTITEPFFGPNSLMMREGESHLQERRLLLPPFHRGSLHHYGRMIAAAAAQAVAHWRPGHTFVAQEVAHAISFDIMTRIFFDLPEHRMQAFKSAFAAAQAAMTPAITFAPFMRRNLLGLGPWARFRRAVDALDREVRDLIALRRATPADDVVSFLLSVRRADGNGLSDSELRDNIVFFITAGHETTASGIAWALYWLHRTPQSLAAVLDEMAGWQPQADPERVAALPYLDAVCKEVLRLGPILPEMVRRVNQPFELMGFELPPGTGIAVIASLAHMDPELHPAPEEFRPERFLAEGPPPYAFIPFGGGVRRCVGEHFALYEMKLVLAALLGRYRFHLQAAPNLRPTRPRAIPLGPNRAVRLTVTALRQPATGGTARAS